MDSAKILTLIGLACLASTAFAHDSAPFEIQKLQSHYAERMEQTKADHLQSLEKLKLKYTKRGDLNSANFVADLIGTTKAEQSEFRDLCQITISTSTSVWVQRLQKNTSRLSGGYRPSFSFVCDDIEGAQFTKVPWKSKPSYKIEVQRSGYLYMTGVYKHNFKQAGLKIHPISKKIQGSYVGQLYAVYVDKGQTLECGGYESCLIANSIIVQ